MALDLKPIEEIRALRERRAQAKLDAKSEPDKGNPKLVEETEAEKSVPLGGEVPEPATRERLS
jgi:hypothetical protein